MDLEEALLSEEPNPIMTEVLARFVLNLRPQTRNLSSDVISSTVTTILQEYFKTPERTVFWDDELKRNVDPFPEMHNGFFAAPWDIKLKILRQLIELQLCHSTEIKAMIDRAWGVIHNKHKKTETTSAPPPSSDPQSQAKLQLLPLGQDKERRRYWAVDASPRLYMSTNPWKITATFQTVASTREEYMAIIDKLREAVPPAKEGERKTKVEIAHLALFRLLEVRVEDIDAELARIQRARRKIEQRNLLIAQAEVRETRTRRRTTRPDYAYMNDPIDEDDLDEYTYQEQEDEDYDEHVDDDDLESVRPRDLRRDAAGSRRSTRSSNATSNGRRSAAGHDDGIEWRGERRSTRLGAPAETQLDEPLPKRARTEDSITSVNSAEARSANSPASNGSSLKIKIRGAAAIKPTETAVEAPVGKKKSKYWYYAVEPVPAPQDAAAAPPMASAKAQGSQSTRNGLRNGAHPEGSHDSGLGHGSNSDLHLYEKSIEGSLSPTSSMDES